MHTPMQRLRRAAGRRPWLGWLAALLLALAPLAQALPVHTIAVPYCTAGDGSHTAPAAPQQVLLVFSLHAAALDHKLGAPPPAPLVPAALPPSALPSASPATPPHCAPPRYALALSRAPPTSLA